MQEVKFTFFRYPFEIEYAEDFEGIIRIPDLLTLAAMKAFALGQRSKWKDYVDLYFMMKLPFFRRRNFKKGKSAFRRQFQRKAFSGSAGLF